MDALEEAARASRSIYATVQLLIIEAAKDDDAANAVLAILQAHDFSIRESHAVLRQGLMYPKDDG
jgi:hypothetical protein